ncbi:MAG: DUF4281 domain-containing protein [Myxococcaceae bacterium]|nr:DUF4281 domain-containing protein [Myxococcaceae bacterium]
MRAETLFQIVSLGVAPAWLLLVFAPRWKWTQRIVHSASILAVLGVIHLSTVLAADFPEGANGMTLQGAMRMFTDPMGMVACWTHYLAFDLFVGAWEVRDAQRHKLPHLAVVPCLVLTYMLGPTGFLLYLALRAVLRGKFSLDEGAGSAKAASWVGPVAYRAAGGWDDPTPAPRSPAPRATGARTSWSSRWSRDPSTPE